MKQGVIFDVDGTLLDSMKIWIGCGERYLKSLGLQPKENLNETMWKMSIPEGIAYLMDQYLPDYSAQQIKEGILDIVRDFYYYEADFKPGMKELLKKLHAHEIPIAIATSSDRSYLEIAFRRLGILDKIEAIVTCEEAGAGKNSSPAVYLKACELMETNPENTWVFEDVEHAIRTAKNAGFKVTGVYDEASESYQESIQRLSDYYIKEEKDLFEVFDKIIEQ